jgi:nucleotide-binding universal stress UspA family protein
VKVLVALDFGDSSLEALRQGRALAHATGGTLAVCHVLPARSEIANILREPDAEESAALTSEEESAKRSLAVLAREKLGLELSEIWVERGAPYAEIVRCAERIGADVVVVGSHGRSGILRLVLGSVAERVARHAHASVLVARSAAKAGVVVAATDLSASSIPAITQGFAAAQRTRGRLVVVSVLEWGNMLPSSAGALVGVMPAVPTPELMQQVRDALKSAVEQAVERAGATGEVRVVEGSAASEIVHVAEELGAELVVVGSHGRSGLARLALGSVAERVIRSAGCSVLAVRSPATS